MVKEMQQEQKLKFIYPIYKVLYFRICKYIQTNRINLSIILFNLTHIKITLEKNLLIIQASAKNL